VVLAEGGGREKISLRPAAAAGGAAARVSRVKRTARRCEVAARGLGGGVGGVGGELACVVHDVRAVPRGRDDEPITPAPDGGVARGSKFTRLHHRSVRSPSVWAGCRIRGHAERRSRVGLGMLAA